MHDALRAGAALFAAGYHRAAHEPWEDAWHDVRAGDGDDAEEYDERDAHLLQGLVQYAAAVHHAQERNWSGATGLAESGQAYLADVPPNSRGVDVASVRDALAALEADPVRVERGSPDPVVVDGTVPAFADLDLDATLLVAPPLAEALGYDSFDVEKGVEYARRDAADEEPGSKFVRFVFDFVRDAEHRAIVAQRLDQHVERRVRKEEDVKGLFG